MKRFAPFALSVAVALALALYPWPQQPVALAQSGVGGGVPSATIDPCSSPTVAKQSAAINITTATTTSLVAVSGSTAVYVCGFAVTVGSTVAPDTFQLVYGTGAACTSPTVMTGTFNAAGVLTGAIFYNTPLAPTPAAQGVCAVTTVGTGPSIQGVLSFVQR